MFLKILIIDEISMVGADMFLEVHRRLAQIKGSVELFGGVTILGFGDMFQLPPVGQPLIFQLPSDSYARLRGSLWEKFLICRTHRDNETER